eukprot:g286.t1
MASRLLSALRKGHDTLLEALQEPDRVDPLQDCGELGRCSLLIHAAYAGDCQAVETLVSHGADFRSLSGAGGSGSVGNCIDWLCWRQEPRVAQTLELLLARWAEQFSEAEVKTMLNTPRHLSRTPLMNAVFAPNVASTEVLLRHGADAAYAGEDGSCALDLAAQLGGSRGSKLVQMLLEAHADPNVGSIGPLFLAAQENSETSVKALLAAKARPGGLGFDGPGGKDREALTTPVECAARFGFLRVLKLLLAADGAPRGLDLKLALTLAQEAGHSDVERILLRAGAAPDAKRPADADALEEALLLPEGFVPGQADSEEVEGQIQVEEVDGSYRLRFPGPSHLTASSATPARMCAAHDSFYYEVLVEEPHRRRRLREAQELHKQNRPDAAAWRFLSLAEAGHEVAQMNVAQLLDSGAASLLLNSSQPMPLKAIEDPRLLGRAWAQRHYELSAEQGNAFSELGRESDLELSLAHYRRTAQMRISGEWMQSFVARASFNLGFMYQFGIGVEQDLPMAGRFYGQGAEADPGGVQTPITIMSTVLSFQSYLAEIPTEARQWDKPEDRMKGN